MGVDAAAPGSAEVAAGVTRPPKTWGFGRNALSIALRRVCTEDSTAWSLARRYDRATQPTSRPPTRSPARKETMFEDIGKNQALRLGWLVPGDIRSSWRDPNHQSTAAEPAVTYDSTMYWRISAVAVGYT